jgi:hypothetical protein
MAVAVLTALGERGALGLDAERRPGEALRTMTDDEGLSVARRPTGAASTLKVREIRAETSTSGMCAI